MAYVDGYLIPVPKKNLAAYRKLAKAGSKVWIRPWRIGVSGVRR